MKKIILFLLLLLLPLSLARAGELSERLKGRILLQVESKGEAWYVNPDNQKRFYLGRPADAFRVMRELGLGVSNKDFNSFNGLAPDRLAGKILLKVEDNGQAYYVNPVDLKMHYLGRPRDAFNIMRNLGLGITNDNLDLIEIDGQSSPVLIKEAEEATKTTEEIIEEDVVEEVATTTEEAIKGTEEEAATSTEEVAVEDLEDPLADSPQEAGQAGQDTATSTCVWLAEYYDNKSLFGSPVATSVAPAVNFDWGVGGPEEITKINTFSARFTADCYFEEGTYEFQTKFDDAIRVYLDDVNFLQSWTDNNKTRIFNRERTVEQGEHKVKVEYYDASGKALINVGWVKINEN